MTTAADRMKAMRKRRRSNDLREIRIITPNARLLAVRQRVAQAVARLDPQKEAASLDWVEKVSEFDQDAGSDRR